MSQPPPDSSRAYRAYALAQALIALMLALAGVVFIAVVFF